VRTIDKFLIAVLRELVKIEIRVGERGGGSIQVYAPFEGAEHFEFTITIPGYSAEQIFHQFRILLKHGLVETDISGDPIIVPYMNFSRVTDAGHQLLADCDAEPSPPPNPIGFVHF
jgi:hypothetical protein